MSMEHYPMEIGDTPNGSMLHLVCNLKVFDNEHCAHLLTGVDGLTFLYTGFLDEGYHSYTIFSGLLKQQFPIPVVSPTKETKVLGHRKPSRDSLKAVVDLCAGFGGLAQGAHAAGFNVQVSVDQNPKMLELHAKACNAHRICGDIGDRDVICEIWRHSGGASTLTSGFSCQPFSQLGDCKSKGDDRSNCLTKTLRTAYYLQAQVIILECVSPAAQDDFVKSELQHFMKHTGYHCSHTDLKLDQVWSTRRHRSWWVLSSPEVGPVHLHDWVQLSCVNMVQHVIPEIRPWHVDDEMKLALDLTELQAFGVNDDLHARYLFECQIESSMCPACLGLTKPEPAHVDVGSRVSQLPGLKRKDFMDVWCVVPLSLMAP